MIKKHINKICFIVLNILVVIVFLPWLTGHYATDTYNIMNVGYEHYSIHNSLIDGRIFMFLIMQLASILQIECKVLNFILLFLALIVSNISVLIIKNIVSNNMKNKNIKTEIFSYIISYTLIYNFMYIENLYFFECFVMAIGVLLNLIAAKIFETKSRRYLIKTTTLVLISAFCYQGTISSFLAFTILFEALKKQSFKSFVKNIIISILIVGIACICNFAFVQIISNYLGLYQTRLNNDIIYNIIYILKTKLDILLYTANTFYYGLFMAFLIMLVVCFIYGFRFKENKERYYIFFIFLILGTIFCADLPYLMSLTAFGAGRTRFAIGALCSIIVIYILGNLEVISENYRKNIKIFLQSFLIVYFMINIINYVDIIKNTKIANQCEKEYVEEIDEYIKQYETENNINIEKIQLVYNGDSNNAFYPSCTRWNVMTWNAASCWWSTIGTVNFYTNRNLIQESNDLIEMEMEQTYEIKNDVLYVEIAVI